MVGTNHDRKMFFSSLFSPLRLGLKKFSFQRTKIGLHVIIFCSPGRMGSRYTPRACFIKNRRWTIQSKPCGGRIVCFGFSSSSPREGNLPISDRIRPDADLLPFHRLPSSTRTGPGIHLTYHPHYFVVRTFRPTSTFLCGFYYTYDSKYTSRKREEKILLHRYATTTATVRKEKPFFSHLGGFQHTTRIQHRLQSCRLHPSQSTYV